MAGIHDIDIRREALSTKDIQSKTLNEVIEFVEGREMARNATPSASLSAMSSFKRGQAASSKLCQPLQIDLRLPHVPPVEKHFIF